LLSDFKDGIDVDKTT